MKERGILFRGEMVRAILEGQQDLEQRGERALNALAALQAPFHAGDPASHFLSLLRAALHARQFFLEEFLPVNLQTLHRRA